MDDLFAFNRIRSGLNNLNNNIMLAIGYVLQANLCFIRILLNECNKYFFSFHFMNGWSDGMIQQFHSRWFTISFINSEKYA